MSTEPDYLLQAVRLGAESAASGGGPFGAVVVTADGTAYPGNNEVTATFDPTAHAEVQALRAAARGLGTHDLSGSTLFTSCQPCPMCLTAALWARVDRIVYAADQEDAARAGFDDSAFYRQLERGLETVTFARVDHRDIPERLEPFEAWAANSDRVEY